MRRDWIWEYRFRGNVPVAQKKMVDHTILTLHDTLSACVYPSGAPQTDHVSHLATKSHLTNSRFYINMGPKLLLKYWFKPLSIEHCKWVGFVLGEFMLFFVTSKHSSCVKLRNVPYPSHHFKLIGLLPKFDLKNAGVNFFIYTLIWTIFNLYHFRNLFCHLRSRFILSFSNPFCILFLSCLGRDQNIY